MDAQRGGLALLASAHFATARLVEGFPHIFTRDLDSELKPVLTFLETVGVPNESLGRVLLLFPPLLLCNPDRDLQSRLRTLKKVLHNISHFSQISDSFAIHCFGLVTHI
jgi:mTERF domain-containing protein